MSFSLKHQIERIVKEKAPGPSATFSVLHVLRALELVSGKPVGRNQLAQKLSIGGGAARTIINRLKNAGLIDISRAGCVLTKKGSALWHDYESIVKSARVEKSEIAGSDFNVAVLVRSQVHKLKSGIEQRDAAVVAGASNATSMAMKRGRLVIPFVSEDVSKDFPKVAKQVVSLLEPKDGDVVIIVGADASEKAIYGAMAAAWVLLD